jgi:hypothetical protein
MTDRSDDSAGARAVTVHGPVGPADLVVPALATVGEVARACADSWALPTLPLLYTRTGEALPVAGTMAALAVETGAVLVAVTAVVRHAPVRDAGDDLGFGGGGCRRGRRRRDVVSTRDGTEPGHALRRCRDGG